MAAGRAAMAMTPDERQRVLDEEHLRLLTLFHYVSGGITLVFGAMFAFMMGMMALAQSFLPAPGAVSCGKEFDCPSPAPAAPPEFLPWIFLAFFGVFVVLFLAYGALEIYSGRAIARRRRRVFSLVVSLPGALFIPYGTILTIFTLVVLERPSVKALYRESEEAGK